MATSTAAKPYVVAGQRRGAPRGRDTVGVGHVRGGRVAGRRRRGTCSGGSPRSTARATSTRPGLLYSTLETWGWVAIGWSALLADRWHHAARAGPGTGPAVGIVLAAVSCVFWLFALPVMPFYAMTVMFVDILVIYGLVTGSSRRVDGTPPNPAAPTLGAAGVERIRLGDVLARISTPPAATATKRKTKHSVRLEQSPGLDPEKPEGPP